MTNETHKRIAAHCAAENLLPGMTVAVVVERDREDDDPAFGPGEVRVSPRDYFALQSWGDR